MRQLGFFEILSDLFKIVFSSPFFIALFVLLVLTTGVLIANIKTNKKIIRVIVSIIYAILAIFLIYKYFPSINKLLDSIVDKVFLAIYFPNYISYICMLIIATLLFIRNLLDKGITKLCKIVNLGAYGIILFLFILTLDVITKNNIDITLRSSVYSSDTLLILIESTTLVFVLWIVIFIIDELALYIIKRNNKKIVIQQKTIAIENTKVNEKEELVNIDNDFTFLSEDSFYEGYQKYYKKKQYDEYMKIVSSDEDNLRK